METVEKYRPGGSTHISFTMAAVSALTAGYCYNRMKTALGLAGYGLAAAGFVYGAEEIQNGRHVFGHDMSMFTSVFFAGLSTIGAVATRRIMFPPLILAGIGSAYYQRNKANDWREDNPL
eukprot:TRINITY_DN14924_c0_g1_i1.p2 TRINITY_DN14924_c0_g1~~TRINITY_DN14924_c0_g1_i1.p2  ORF type:complete len:131 (-),score=14.19 TRINITY_DN14924_c0_g1_i1:277-636(-)